MVFSKAALAGATGVVGLVLGITMGVTGANAVSHHSPDRGKSHSVTQEGQRGHGQKKDFTGGQSGEQRHKRFAAKDDGNQAKPDGTTKQNSGPDTSTEPSTK